MGQAASMCRFRGCRYKKQKSTTTPPTTPPSPTTSPPQIATPPPASPPPLPVTTATATSSTPPSPPSPLHANVQCNGNKSLMANGGGGATWATATTTNTSMPHYCEPLLRNQSVVDADEVLHPIITAGLQLRSIEEPSSTGAGQHLNHHHHTAHHHHHNLQNNNNNNNSGSSNSSRLGHTEQGGTGYTADGLRTGVPLLTTAGHNHHLHLQYHHNSHGHHHMHHHSGAAASSSMPSSSQYHGGSAGIGVTVVPMSPIQTKIYDAEHARMEAWMDENQEFVQDYFIRKATRQVVDAWLVSHATSAGNDVVSGTIGSPTHPYNGQNCSSRGGSGATTPVRKISAHEFERGGLLKPIVNTIDGTPTFLSIGTTNDSTANSMATPLPPSPATTTMSLLSATTTTSSTPSPVGVSNGGGVAPVSGAGTAGSPNGSIGEGGFATANSPSSASSCGICGLGNGSTCGHQHNQQQTQPLQQQHQSQLAHAATGGVQNHNYPSHHHHHLHGHYRPQRLSRNELKQLDEKELIFELVKDICNELEVRTLCHKILQNVSILLNADRGSLFLVQGRCNGADGPKKCLVSKLFDVCPRSTVEEMEQREEVRVAWGSGIAGHVAESGEPVNIPDAYQDERFNCEIDSLTGYRTKALLCMPIKDSAGDVIGVAQVINKLNGECFTKTDEKVFASYLQFCGIGLRNAQLYEKSQLEIKRNQVLLDLARMIFEEQSTIEHMVFRILTHMQSLIQCQRVQILLLHEASKGSFSRVFDFEANDLSEEESVARTSPYESRFPINIGITGYVATTGETVNVPNAYEDDRFDASVDDASGFKHKAILCMAIKNSLGQIIGVIQLVNKFDDLVFTKNDENFVEAFAIFCGMGIHNTHMYEKAIVAMAKQSVTLEVLSYHASATMDEAHRLRKLRVPSAAHFRLHDFKFDDIHFEDDDTLKACLRMFLDLDFVERFHIDYEVLCRWLLSVKKNYRNVTYHNWRHAFNVAQMMFAILTATQWWKVFGEIECLALIIGCLCHDLDHRGTNNSFQIKASSPLAQLYSTSTMEHHHFDQCLMILNSPGNQILGNLSSEDYCRVIHVLEDAILSTDLAVYFRKREPFLQSVHTQPASYWASEEPRALLRAMSMTVCDLSAITKPWDIEKRVADLVSSEFFEQGDMEKQELNITPIDIMNREKEDELPMMQVGFIESICLPIYEAFAHLSDKLEPLVEGVRDNRSHWIELAQNVQNKGEASALAAASSADDSAQEGEQEAVTPVAASEVDSDGTLKTPAQTDAEEDDDDVVIEEDNGIEADDDDSDAGHVDERPSCPSNACHSSGSSRGCTPPPTGEEDSSPNSPSGQATTAAATAKLIAANLNSLNAKSLKSSGHSGCRSCDYARSHNVRKASSLKGASEMGDSHGQGQNGCGCCNRSHSKSTPSMLGSGGGGSSPSSSHHHSHGTHHHRHHQHSHGHGHSHHHHHCQHNGVGNAGGSGGSGNASGAEGADRIPKIVGKLYGTANASCLEAASVTGAAAATTGIVPVVAQQPAAANGLTANGKMGNCTPAAASFIQRRHSETNGGMAATPVVMVNPQAALCDK